MTYFIITFFVEKEKVAYIPIAKARGFTLELVKEIVGEMDFVSKQLYQMEDVSTFMLDMAEKYVNNTEMQKQLDTVYGEGSTLFIGQALKAFYK